MTRSVTGLFATWEQVDRAEGALRDPGAEADRITIVDPGGQIVRPHCLDTWLVEHLLRHGHPRAGAGVS